MLPCVTIKASWMDEEKLSEWLREIYTKVPDGVFDKISILLICNSERAQRSHLYKPNRSGRDTGFQPLQRALWHKEQKRDSRCWNLGAKKKALGYFPVVLQGIMGSRGTTQYKLALASASLVHSSQ